MLAKKRGQNIPAGSTKAQIIKILRGKVVRKRGVCYEAMTKAELLKRATKKNINGRECMTKDQLITALRK